MGGWSEILKRFLDIVGALFGLVVFSPIILILWLVIRKNLGSPVLFKQIRPGRDGVPFEMIKFRSMRNALNENGELAPDVDRMTPLGRRLRSSSMDELPGLWNVLKGDMSLVGPRPLLMEYLPLYSTEQARRHEVRPGVTGWAQVNGRNAITWEEKLALDVWYVDNRSIALDIKILGQTVMKVIKRSDISAEGEATMPKFEGTNLGKKP